MCDPAAVEVATTAGLGATVDLELGNVRPLGLGTDPRPRMRARARVRALTDGRFRITGPIYTGETWAMGRTAVLEAEDFTAGGHRAADGAARPRRVHQHRPRSGAASTT